MTGLHDRSTRCSTGDWESLGSALSPPRPAGRSRWPFRPPRRSCASPGPACWTSSTATSCSTSAPWACRARPDRLEIRAAQRADLDRDPDRPDLRRAGDQRRDRRDGVRLARHRHVRRAIRSCSPTTTRSSASRSGSARLIVIVNLLVDIAQSFIDPRGATMSEAGGRVMAPVRARPRLGAGPGAAAACWSWRRSSRRSWRTFPGDVADFTSANRLRAPDAVNWLGTDRMGSDSISRILFGARITHHHRRRRRRRPPSLIGVPIGLVAGYYGGWPSESPDARLRHLPGGAADRAGDRHRPDARPVDPQRHPRAQRHLLAVLGPPGLRRDARAEERGLHRSRRSRSAPRRCA